MSETRHYPIRSVSDLYAAEEIEVLLLEEIRDLEPPPTIYSKPEDIQDFEIGMYRVPIGRCMSFNFFHVWNLVYNIETPCYVNKCFIVALYDIEIIYNH